MIAVVDAGIVMIILGVALAMFVFLKTMLRSAQTRGIKQLPMCSARSGILSALRSWSCSGLYARYYANRLTPGDQNNKSSGFDGVVYRWAAQSWSEVGWSEVLAHLLLKG